MAVIHKFSGIVLLVAILLCWPINLQAASGPILNKGNKWRIGYYEGGPFSDYTDTMRTLVNGLIEQGWIREQSSPMLLGDITKPYWEWLSQCNTPFLAFRAEDGYSAGWDEQKRSEIRSTLLQKLRAGELDLVIAMGTWAGQDLANNAHSVPTMVLSTSEPVRAGIIKSPVDSGLDHVTARIDPHRYLRQIRMFHRIVGFHSIGVAYQNTPEGRIYSAIDDVNQIAAERGFKVVLCEVADSSTEEEKSDRSCMECYKKLSQQAGAVYITALTCFDRDPEAYADIFRKAKIPSFSMMGSKFVKQGIMISISSDSGYVQLGRYNAEKFGAILNGTRPRDLQQVLQDPLEIAVNMETVRQIGFNMPESILRIAAEVYER